MPPLNYFQHFLPPADAPASLAMSPCWGTGKTLPCPCVTAAFMPEDSAFPRKLQGVVIASKSPEVKVGTRIHGYFPFSPAVVLTPTKADTASFMDAAPVRLQELIPATTATATATTSDRGRAACSTLLGTHPGN